MEVTHISNFDISSINTRTCVGAKARRGSFHDRKEEPAVLKSLSDLSTPKVSSG